jgi:hypothetical protein
MPYFLNPFKKHDVSEFPGVLVPLQQARHRSSVISKIESTDTRDDTSIGSALTIDSLKAEIESDLAASGVNGSYDST